jgi:hypothetical protein
LLALCTANSSEGVSRFSYDVKNLEIDDLQGSLAGSSVKTTTYKNKNHAEK